MPLKLKEGLNNSFYNTKRSFAVFMMEISDRFESTALRRIQLICWSGCFQEGVNLLSIHAIDSPVTHFLGTSSEIEFDRRLVPEEDLPLEAFTVRILSLLSECNK